MLTPIYQYYADNPRRYRYSQDPNIGDEWTREGIAFYASSEDARGRVAIHQYYGDNPRRYHYSQDPNVGHGWIPDGVAFYAHTVAAPDTVPIYQYHMHDHADGPWWYLYSSEPNVDGGWINDGIAFYARSAPPAADSQSQPQANEPATPTDIPVDPPINPFTSTGPEIIEIVPITDPDPKVIISDMPPPGFELPGEKPPPSIPIMSEADLLVLGLDSGLSPSISLQLQDVAIAATKSTDPDVLRAAMFGLLLMIVRKTERTSNEQELVAWLARKVKENRVEAARKAIEEHDRWINDPFSYQPPPGFGFEPYVNPPKHLNAGVLFSQGLLPPGLETKDFMELINEQLLTPMVDSNPVTFLWRWLGGAGKKPAPTQRVSAFPSYGTALTYGKILGNDDGVAALTYTSLLINAIALPLELTLLDTGVMLSGSIQALTRAQLASGATFTARAFTELFPYSSKLITQEITGVSKFAPEVQRAANLVGQLKRVHFADGFDELPHVMRLYAPASKIRPQVAKILTGKAIAGIASTIMITLAVTVAVSELISVLERTKIREQLEEHLKREQEREVDLEAMISPESMNTVMNPEIPISEYTSEELEQYLGLTELYLTFLKATKILPPPAPKQPETPLTVVAQHPPAGHDQAMLTTTVTATFSMAMDPETVNANSFRLTGPDGEIPATVTYDEASKTARLQPNGQLRYATSYTVQIRGARDIYDRELSPSATWSFRTRPYRRGVEEI